MKIEKKKIILTRTVLALVLAAVMLAALFLPIFKIGTLSMINSERYTNGTFTQYASLIGKVDVGLFTFIDVIREREDISLILEIQYRESYLTYLRDKMEDTYTYAEMQDDEEKKAEIIAEVDADYEMFIEKSAEIEELAATLDEDTQIRLAGKLSDERFVEALTLSHYYAELFTDGFVETWEGEQGTGIVNVVGSVMEFIIISAFVLAIPIWILILFALIAVHAVRFAIRAKKQGLEAALEKPVRFPFTACAITFAAIMLLWMSVGIIELSWSVGVIMIFAACLAGAVVTALSRILTSEAGSLSDRLVNLGVSVVPVVLLGFFCINFAGVGFIRESRTSVYEFTQSYIDSCFEDIYDESKSVSDMYEELNAATVFANVKNTVIVYSVTVIGTAVAMVGMCYFVGQIAREGGELKRAKRKVSAASLVICAVVVAVALFPSIVGTESLTARNEAYGEGKYKLLWNADVTSGTAAYTEYETYVKAYHSYKQVIEEAKVEENQLEDTKLLYEIVDMKLARLAQNEKSMTNLCLFASVALLLSEFVYFYVLRDDKRKSVAVVLTEEAFEPSEADAEAEQEENEIESETENRE